MANPRKFSEKIALHKQRQAEERNAYERVLMEVRSVTNPAPSVPNPPVQSAQPVVSKRPIRKRPGKVKTTLPLRETSIPEEPMNCASRMPHLQIPPRMGTHGGGAGLTPNDPRQNMWRSMPNIHAEMGRNHSGGQGVMPPTSTNGNNWQNPYFDPSMGNFPPNPNQVNQFQPNPYNQPRMQQHNSMSNFATQMGGGGIQQTQVYLEPPNHNWNPNQNHPNQNHFPNRMANLEVENGSILSRATSDSALHHSVQQKINDSKQKNLLTLNNKTQRKPESWSDFDSYERENSIRRLRPPQLTPQGAQSGSLPDLTNLHIPSSPSTPPVSSNNEEMKRVESPATGRLRRGNPSVNQPQMNSPRQPRRPHPYVNQQRGYLGPGSSPSSPIATQPVNQRTSSLPSSPQQPKQDETLKKNNCLSPSPVPEIVLTPSDTSDTSWGGADHPLQMNSQSVYQPPQQQFNNFDPNIDFQNLTNSNNHCGASSQNTFLSDLSNPYVPPTQQMNHHPPLQQPYNPFSPPQPAGPGLDQVLTRPNERELAELLQE